MIHDALRLKMIDQQAYHHLEFHSTDPSALLNLFQWVYGFQLAAQYHHSHYQQWLLESSNCRILISSVRNDFENNEFSFVSHSNDYNILSDLLKTPEYRRFFIERNTVFNVALIVKSVQSILDRNSTVEVISPCRVATDQYGSIEYACIKSCIGNVVHTLIDLSKYNGPYLPGFQTVEPSDRLLFNENPIIDSIDHVAFAVSRNESLKAIDWYGKVFGMKRFFVNEDEDPFGGFSVRVGDLGMRLFASEYWKCSETACVDNKMSNMKFVFAESLLKEDSNVTDQINKFIHNHNGESGVQHVGFSCYKNIKDAVRKCKERGAEFLQPCLAYYCKENNGATIEKLGESIDELANLGILLDEEIDSTEEKHDKSKVLLQIFTKSIFNNDTFFLELIERRGASGFGAGNIRTLWKIVQEQMNKNRSF